MWPTLALSAKRQKKTVATEALKEGMWVRMVLKEINMLPVGPTTLLCDNNRAICLSECMNEEEITLRYINTHDNLVDIFTKGLHQVKFIQF